MDTAAPSLSMPAEAAGRIALRRELRAWALLAIAALAVAGVFALLLIFSRTPRLQDVLPWPWQSFFRQALVTHVMFSFVVWYLGVLGAMTVVAAARLAPDLRRGAALGWAGIALVAVAFVLMFAPALLDLGEPSLNNYVPVLVTPVYFAGVILLFAGVGLAVLRFLVNLPGRRAAMDAVTFGIAVTGLMYLVALVCFALAWALIPAGTPAATRIEYVFWGGGHVLQFVNTALLLIGWQILGERAFDAGPLPARVFRANMALTLLFVLPAPMIYVLYPVTDFANKDAFTDLFKYGLIGPPLLAALAVWIAMIRHRGPLPWRRPEFAGLFLSVLLFGVGGVMGYFLGPADTRIPSHYHAVIGGVNLAMMALFLSLFLPLLGRAAATGRSLLAMLYLYGVGQLIWSGGMFLAGTLGVSRKTAGAEQGLDSLAKRLAMDITGLGGLIAVVGGVLFIWVVLGRLLRRAGDHA